MAETTGLPDDPHWWRHAVVYQIYPRSFADANGDGMGDIEGMRRRLPYLRDLDVDAIWVSPWYRSPFLDGGYDVADFRDIDPRFGTLADAEAFIAEAHEHGIRVIVDLVPNHTSSEHRWFQEALASPPDADARRRYIIRDGKGPDGSMPPTNWTSVFGGPAWSRLPDGQWYLHLFETTQPDLNWEHPDIGDEFERILRFWLDRGADGFRVDVAHTLMKDQTFPDVEGGNQILAGDDRDDGDDHPHWDRDDVHPIYRRWRSVLDEYGPDRMMVAEAWVSPERLPLYVRPDEFHQSFDFTFLTGSFDAGDYRTIAGNSIDGASEVGSSPTWVLSNHDVVRHATRYGLPRGVNWRRWLLDGPHDVLDRELGQRRARAAALFVLALPGSTYVYQGDELGLDEVWDLPTEVLDDPVWEMSGHTMKGRDGSRVPIPWTAGEPGFGWGDDPWLPQPDWFADHAADVLDGDPRSMLELYRRALAARRAYLVADQTITWLDEEPGVVAFDRGTLRCVLNFGAEAVPVPDGEIVVASNPDQGASLEPDTAVWLR